MIEGTEVLFSTDGGATWGTLGILAEPFVCTPEGVDVTPVEVDRAFASGSFSISGTLEVEVRNYQLEALLRRPIPWAEPIACRSPDSKSWLKRKKGRAHRGY